jgi:hypothetical protein
MSNTCLGVASSTGRRNLGTLDPYLGVLDPNVHYAHPNDSAQGVQERSETIPEKRGLEAQADPSDGVKEDSRVTLDPQSAATSLPI